MLAVTLRRGIILLGHAPLVEAGSQIWWQAVLWHTGSRWRGLNAGCTRRRRLLASWTLLLGVIGILIGIRRLGWAVICGPTVWWGPRAV